MLQKLFLRVLVLGSACAAAINREARLFSFPNPPEDQITISDYETGEAKNLQTRSNALHIHIAKAKTYMRTVTV